MIYHHSLGQNPFTRSGALQQLIATGKINLAGNKNLKIYGELVCSSGKRMKLENRVFFKNEEQAIANGYRPCGKCMPGKYNKWKINNGTI